MTVQVTGAPWEIRVEQIKYPADKRKRFVAKVCREIREAREARAEQREPQWETSVAQYQGRLERDDAGPRDCRLDFTQSRELADSMAARMINPVMGYRQLFVADELNPAYADEAQRHEAVSAHIAPKKVYLEPMFQGFQQAAVYGTCWVKVDWDRVERQVRTWGAVGRHPAVRTVVVREGSFPKVVHTPNMLWPGNSGDDIDAAPWIAERYQERPSEIEAKSERGQSYRTGLKAAELEKLAKAESRPKQELGVEREGGPTAPREDAPRDLYQVCIPHPDDGVETILWLDVDNEIELGWVENWYFDHQRPYRRFAFRSIIGSLDGESLMAVLENLHKAYTALLAIILDHSTRATEKLIVALEGTGLKEQFADGRLYTGFVEAAGDVVADLKQSILDISLQGNLGDLRWVLELLEVHMNNVSSIASAMFGHEVADRPTAYGTDRVLTEAQQPLSLMLERWLQFWADVHAMQYSRYRQYKPEGMAFFERVENGLDHELVSHEITWPAGYWGEQIGFRTSVSSQSMSREIRKQELLALLERLPQILNGLLPLAERALAGDPLAMLIGQLVRRYLAMIEDFFAEFQIATGSDELEGGLFSALEIGEEYARIVEQLQGQIQQLQGKLAQYEPPGMAPGMVGPAGPQGAQAGPGGMAAPPGAPGLPPAGGPVPVPAAPPGPPVAFQ